MHKANFWKDDWLSATPPKNLVPNLYNIVARKNRMVQEVLSENKWLANLRRNITEHHLVDFVSLYNKITQVALTPNVPDDIS